MVNIKIITYILAVIIISLFTYLIVGSSSDSKRDAARADFDKFNQRKANININDSKNAGGRQW